MLSSILSFLGGSAFRMLWGEASSWLTKQQDHKHELERMRLQGELDAAQHDRNMASIKVQADLGVKAIAAQAEADVGRIEAESWLSVVQATGKSVGVAWVDAWNAAIRPCGATWAVVMMTLDSLAVTGVVVKPSTLEVCFAFLGLFVADRTLGKRGK